MTSPTEFPELVTDYEVDWDKPGSCGHDECAEKAKNLFKEGEHYEHGFVHLDNGYVVSVLRLSVEDRQTEGFEDGLWEVAVGVDANPLIKAVLGVEYMPAEDDVLTELGIPEGKVGNLDSAGVNGFITRVGRLAKPAHEDEQGTLF